jgi:hypothetical protein
MGLTRRFVVAAILGSSLLAVPVASGGFPRFGAGCKRDDFESGGSTVRAELCRSHAAGGRAVVVLHGCGGFSTFDHRLVTTLPTYGISTLDVDYFGPTPHRGTRASAMPAVPSAIPSRPGFASCRTPLRSSARPRA